MASAAGVLATMASRNRRQDVGRELTKDFRRRMRAGAVVISGVGLLNIV